MWIRAQTGRIVNADRISKIETWDCGGHFKVVACETLADEKGVVLGIYADETRADDVIANVYHSLTRKEAAMQMSPDRSDTWE